MLVGHDGRIGARVTPIGTEKLSVAVALCVLLAVAGVHATRQLRDTADQRRREASAQYAAEAGIEMGKRALRLADDWSSIVSPANRVAMPLPGLEGPQTLVLGQALPDGATFLVEVHNNLEDPGLQNGLDEDGTGVLRSTGRLPDGTSRMMEITISRRRHE